MDDNASRSFDSAGTAAGFRQRVWDLDRGAPSGRPESSVVPRPPAYGAAGLPRLRDTAL